MQPRVGAARSHSAIIPLLFVASVMLACVISSFTFGLNFAGFALFLFPLLFALPIFVFLNGKLKKRGILGTTLPLLVLPLLFSLLFIYMMFYERNPQHMFKVYVADPIPVGVTNIRARYLDEGFYEDVLVTFQASPEIINTIITQKKLEKAAVQYDHPDRDLPEYSWEGNWIRYERTLYAEDGDVTGYIKIWVDPEKSIVIFRRVV
jgi:hypothetical protein